MDVPFQDVTYISKRYNRSFETSRYYGAGYVARFGAHNPANLRITSSLGYDENSTLYLLSIYRDMWMPLLRSSTGLM